MHLYTAVTGLNPSLLLHQLSNCNPYLILWKVYPQIKKCLVNNAKNRSLALNAEENQADNIWKHGQFPKYVLQAY